VGFLIKSKDYQYRSKSVVPFGQLGTVFVVIVSQVRNFPSMLAFKETEK